MKSSGQKKQSRPNPPDRGDDLGSRNLSNTSSKDITRPATGLKGDNSSGRAGLWERFSNLRTLRVPQQVRSLSGAVSNLGDCGRILLAPGTYHEKVIIRPGTKILIEGDGPEPARLLPAQDDPIIQVMSEAQLMLVHTIVSARTEGITLGEKSSDAPARFLGLLDTKVQDGSWGICGCVKQFHIEGGSFESNGHGLGLLGSGTILDSFIINNKFAAVLTGSSHSFDTQAAWNATEGNIVIKGVNVSNNKEGGIVVSNAQSATIENTYVHKNGYIGIQVRTTKNFLLENVRIVETDLYNNNWGDGLVVVHSTGLVEKSQFSANKRANIIYYGDAKGTIRDNLIIYGVFSISLESLDGLCPLPDIINNYCYGNQENDVCFGMNLCPTPLPELPPL